jgi:hypothetical protein
MHTTSSIKNLSKALLTFNVKIDTIRKDAKNPFFKSTYATLSNILDAIKDPLIESGLVITQHPEGEDELITMLIHAETGEFISSSYRIKPVKDDPQSRISANTYQRRSAIASILSLNIDDDDDGNTATHGGKTPEEATKNEKPWLNKGTESFTKALQYMKQPDADINMIKKKYRLSKEIETLLLNA